MLLYLPLTFAENWDLKKDDWKQDVIPEIWEGKNIADFIDPEILEVGRHSVHFVAT